ncbi:hypothetical protein FOZ63_028442, partial [Perkinsus olseni]
HRNLPLSRGAEIDRDVAEGGAAAVGEFDNHHLLSSYDEGDLRYQTLRTTEGRGQAWSRMESVDSCHGEVAVDDTSPNRVAQTADEYFAGRGRGKRRSRSGSGVMLSSCPAEVLAAEIMPTPGIEPATTSVTTPAKGCILPSENESIHSEPPVALASGDPPYQMMVDGLSSSSSSIPPATVAPAAPLVAFKPFIGDASAESSPTQQPQPTSLDYMAPLEATLMRQQAAAGRRGALMRGRSILERFNLVEESDEEGSDAEDEVNLPPDAVQTVVGGVAQLGASQPSGIDALARLQMSMMNQHRKKKEKGRIYSHRTILERLNLLEESDDDEGGLDSANISSSSPSPDLSTSSAESSSAEDHRLRRSNMLATTEVASSSMVHTTELDTPRADLKEMGNRRKRRRAERHSLARLRVRPPLDPQETAHEIFPRIFLGGHIVARNRELLRKYNITSVVCCCTITEYPEDIFFTSDGIDYYRVDVEDMSCEPIDWFWDEAHEHMDKTLRPYMEQDTSPSSSLSSLASSSGCVLIHCRSGVSRSASTLLSYLVKRRGLSLYHALTHVRHCRNIRPNCGFFEKLQELEISLRADGKSTVDRKMYFSWYNNCRDVARDEGQLEEHSSADDAIDNTYSRQIDWNNEPPMVDMYAREEGWDY